MRPFIFLLALSMSVRLSAQVGIGNTIPKAELDISSDNSGIPALRLRSQTSPLGTHLGQLAFIDDGLYMYDNIRDKWLSVGITAVQFGTNGSVTTGNLGFGGDMVSGSSGALLPYDGTIVGMSVQLGSNVAPLGKEFQARIRNSGGTVDTFSLMVLSTSASISNTTVDLDFSAGDYITVRGRDEIISQSVTDPAVVIWVKWRK